MSTADIWLLVLAGVLTVVAGVFSSADAALSSFSKARAEEIADEGRPGAKRLLVIVEDPPRYLNTALLLRMLCEIAAIVMVTAVMLDLIVVQSVVMLLVVAVIAVTFLVDLAYAWVDPRLRSR